MKPFESYHSFCNAWLETAQGCLVMQDVHPSFQALLSEVRRSLDAELYQAAIMLSLSLPDVCMWLTTDPSPDADALHRSRRNQSKKYKKWFEENLRPRFSNLTADDCYSIRCGVMHQSVFARVDTTYDNIIFLTPEKDIRKGRIGTSNDVIVTIEPNISFGRVQRRVLQMEAVWFCNQLVEAAKSWLSANTEDRNVRANLSKIVRFRPEGLSPYMIGVPLIA